MQVLREQSEEAHIHILWKGHKFVRIEETKHSAIQRVPYPYAYREA